VGTVEAVVVLAVVMTVSAAFAYSARLHHQRALRIRELAHEERMAAVNRGLELPPHEMLDAGAMRSATPRTAFGAGLVLVLGGVGMFAAFTMVPSAGDGTVGLHTLSSLGIIPMFIGVGLLIFAWATRAPSR
jgi:hypothetical protein